MVEKFIIYVDVFGMLGCMLSRSVIIGWRFGYLRGKCFVVVVLGFLEDISCMRGRLYVCGYVLFMVRWLDSLVVVEVFFIEIFILLYCSGFIY